MRAALPPTTRSQDRALRARYRSVVYSKKHRTIRAFAEDLIRLVHYRDGDKRDIGYDYVHIRNCILRKFPKVPGNGLHKGKATRMPYKELQEFACEMNQRGVRLPFRPRRKAAEK